jgi:glycosyltransferase involved in cell wall biosynthesis
VQDGETGLLVPPGDVDALAAAMRRLMDDRPLRERIGRNGGERVRRTYLWSSTGTQYEEMFQQLAGKS